MQNPTKIRGLKFPDIYVVRYFFKECISLAPGRVLELGCGNANNLTLFYQYGWHITGVDYSDKALNNARHNLSLYEGNQEHVLVRHNLSQGLPELDYEYDVILMPGILSYLKKGELIECFRQIREYLKKDRASFFIRLRTPGDYRFSRGEKIDENTFILDTWETGEEGLINTFYFEHEIIDMIRSFLLPGRRSNIPLTILRTQFDDIQNGVLTTNHDIVVWGNIM